MSQQFPKKYQTKEVENKWSDKWVKEKTFAWDKERGRDETFVVDTPPPTVSGSLHMGHVYGYTQADIIVRCQRMLGKNIFFPIGWDDNGLPTERRVQNFFGIKCDTSTTFDKDFAPKKAKKGSRSLKPVARKNFIDACFVQTKKDEENYQKLWMEMGLSYDWSLQYETISKDSQKISQYSFLDLVEKNQVYQADRPVMWDTEFQTSVAQADVVDKEVNGHYHDIEFQTDSGEKFLISTTRPELLGACVAVVAHPSDERFKHLFGKFAVTPLFKVSVPIMPAEHADPEKGTGILMVCTFGDVHDVEFWQQEKLPLRQIISKDGKMMNVEYGTDLFPSTDSDLANTNYAKINGLFVKQAKTKMVELLKEEGSAVDGSGPAMKGDPKPTVQQVKFYEKGQFPLQYVPTHQWYIKLLENRKVLLEQGQKVVWHPAHFYKRYEQWVEGLNQDWCISRQRYFGVPFPVWYKLDSDGEAILDDPIYASPDELPVDPLTDTPKGLDESMRGQKGGFIGDNNVMDTWATSSVTPQIIGRWKLDGEVMDQIFPCDLRPQGHEIIRTWAFYTIAKSWMHHGVIPWKHITLNGWVLAEDKEKMSKSKGNVVTPEDLIKDYSVDTIRYWAGRSKHGQDTVVSEKLLSIGGRLSTKIFNMAKFSLMQLMDEEGQRLSFSKEDISESLDICWLNTLNTTVEEATSSMEKFDTAQALSMIESSFWKFCDYYIELVKSRAYQQKSELAGKSALATLEHSLKTFLKLFAPYMPYITEEIWSWYEFEESKKSIHLSAWPKKLKVDQFSDTAFDCVCSLISEVRGEKSRAQKSLKWPVNELIIEANAEDTASLEQFKSDISKSCHLENEIVFKESEELKFSITLKSE